MSASPYAIERLLPYILIIAGLAGLMASGILTIDKIAVLENPGYVPPCNISPFISCGSIMGTPQSAVLGFPNSLLGLPGFTAVMTIGFTLLAGAELKRWFWLCLQGGLTAAVLSVYWFFYQSVFVINSLCPWCLVFWISTILLFWSITLYNLRTKHLVLPSKLSWLSSYIEQRPVPLLILLYGVIAISILVQFWSYWTMFI